MKKVSIIRCAFSVNEYLMKNEYGGISMCTLTIPRYEYLKKLITFDSISDAEKYILDNPEVFGNGPVVIIEIFM